MGILNNRGINAEGLLGLYYAADFGLQADGQADDARVIQAALDLADTAGGGIVVLPSGGVTIAIGATLKLGSYVELVIPTGTTLKLLAAKNTILIANKGVSNTGCRVTGGGIVDGNKGNQTITKSNIAFTSVTDLFIGSIHSTNATGTGIDLESCNRPKIVGTTSNNNGNHGIIVGICTYASLSSPLCFNNGQIGTGHGIELGLSTDTEIIGAHCYDDQGGSSTQGYGVFEFNDATNARNHIVGGVFTGNKTGDISLNGVGSEYLRSFLGVSAYSDTVSMLTTDDVVLATGGAGGITITLPAANAGKVRKTVKKIDSGVGAVTVARAGTDTIEGATSVSLAGQYNSVTVISDGTSIWYKQSST